MLWKIMKDPGNKFEIGYMLPNHWEKITKEKFLGKATVKETVKPYQKRKYKTK